MTADDLFRAGFVDKITPSTTPSTRSYRNGVWGTELVNIGSISASGPTMTFTYSLRMYGPWLMTAIYQFVLSLAPSVLRAYDGLYECSDGASRPIHVVVMLIV
jgi:hypothetical protein